MSPLLKKSLIGLVFGINIFLTLLGFFALYNSPYTGIRLAVSGDAACVKSVDRDSPAYQKITPGDRLIGIEGRPIPPVAFNSDPSYIRSRKVLRIFWEAQRKLTEVITKERPVKLLIERDGGHFEVALTPVPFPLYRALARTVPLYFVGWIFLIVAYLVLRKNDHEIAVANIVIGFFVCISFASLAPFAYRDLFLPVSAFRTLLVTGNLGSQGFSCAAIHLLLIFPRRKGILLRYPRLIVAPYIVYAVVATVHLAGVFDTTYVTTYAFTNTCLLVFFGNLLYNFFVEKNILYKRQIQWVVFGMLTGITAWLGMTSIPIVLGSSFIPEEISVLPTVIYPLCFSFAVTKYRLMDIESIFDAAVVYGGTIVILEGIELAVLGTMSKYISAVHGAPYLPLLGVLVIVFLYVPLRNRVKNGVERLFKRGKYDIEKETQRFIAGLGQRDGSSPLEKFSLFAEELLGPSGICIMKFRGGNGSVYFLEGEKAERTVGEIERAKANIHAYFSGRTSCAFGYDLAPALGETGADIDNSLFVYLSAGEEGAYLVALLPKWNTTAYSNKDRALLSAVSAQLAKALDAEQRYVPTVKITAPKATPGFVLRERLFDMLDEKGAHCVIWVTGPAGSGKTTLASSYLESRKRPSLWYNIDEGDGDIATFFYYLREAAGRAYAGKRKPLPLFTPEYQGGMPVFTKRYFEDLCSSLLSPRSSRLSPDGFVIVFDNYQDAPADSVFHEMIAHGFEAVPEGIRIIVLSRGEPPAQFARLIANRGISFIGWEDIRLTKDESREIVRMKRRGRISDDVSDRLYEIAGGWAAGLILMLERTKFKESDFRLRNDLAPAEIFTYFANEIFDKMDKETRDFLLKTSFLPEMTAETAERLTGAGASWQTLYRLSRNHYFTERHSGEKTVYRYHPLFREFLLARAAEDFSKDEVAQVQRKAAALLGESGKIEDAVEFLIKAADWNGAVEMITTHVRSLLTHGRTRTLSQWLAAVPDDVMERFPWLMYWSGVCRSPAEYLESRVCFEKAFHRFQEANDVAGMLLSWASIMDTIVYEFGELHRIEPWIIRLNDHLSEHPDFPSPEIEFKVVSSMMVALMFTRYRYEDICPWVERALRLLPSCPDINLRISTSAYVALFYVWTGELHKAGNIVNEQQRWCRSSDATPLNLIIGKYTEALHQWIAAYPDFGVRAAEEGLELGSAHGIHMLDHHLHARKLFGALNSGNLAAAKVCFDMLQAATDGSGMRQMVKFQYHYLPPWYSLLREEYTPALQQARASLKVCDEAGGSAFHRAFSNLMVAHALIESVEYAEAGERLSEVHRIAAGLKSPIIEFTCLLSESYLLFRRAAELSGTDNVSAAGLDTLQCAMKLGRECGYMNTIAWLPQVIAYLCARALEADIEVEYVRELVKRHGLAPPYPDPELKSKSRIPHLTLEHWPWPLKVITLGKFEALSNDTPVQVEQKSARRPIELLKAIVSFGEAGADKAQLIEALWPDAEGDAGNHAFETALYRLRKLLGCGDVIALKNNRLTLDPCFCWVDAWAFERAVARIDKEIMEGRSEKRGDANRPASLYEKAIDLYKGQFLPADEGQPWTATPRERLRDKFLRVVAGLSRHWERTGKWKKAVECYRKGLEADPLAEEFYQGLMTCYHRLGLRAEVVKTYQRCKDALKSSLGMEPSSGTEAVYQAIREHR